MDSFDEKAKDGFQFLKEDELAESVNRLNDKIDLHFGQKTKVKVRKLPDWAMAAALAFLIGASTFFYFQKPSREELFAEYFEPYPNIAISIERGENDVLTNKEKAFKFYEAADYEKAIDILELVIKSEPSDSESQLYLGISHLAKGNVELAEVALKNISEYEKIDQLKEISKWYLALIRVKKSDLEPIEGSQKLKEEVLKTELNSIKNSESDFAEEAGELLQKLD